MSVVNRLTYIELEVPDIQPQLEHYIHVLGLKPLDQGKGQACFASGIDGYTVLMREGSAARCTGLGFEATADADIEAFSKRLASEGIKSERRKEPNPVSGGVLTFADPKGTRIDLHEAGKTSPIGYSKTGIIPNKLGHVAFNLQSLDTTLRFYTDMLGFRVSDWLGDFFVFLRCGPDHHTCNFVGNSKSTKMHHMAFELRDFAHIKDACDLLAREGIPVIWGPVRHGCGHNISIYYRDPAGHMIELFCELDRIVDEKTGAFEPRPWHQDFPQKPQTWTDVLKAASQWGTPIPEGFLD